LRRLVLILLFLLVFFGALIASTPVNFALERAGLTARGLSYDHASGTLWRGALHGVNVGGQAVGEVRFRTRPSALLGGKLAVDLDINGPAGAGRGDARIGFDRSVDVRNLIADVNVQALTRLDPRLRQSPAKLTASITRFSLSGSGACRNAEGAVETDILSALGGRYAWEGPDLSGTLSCDDDATRVRLENKGGEDDIIVNASLKPPGIWTTDARVSTSNPGVLQALRALDFEDRDGAWFYRNTNNPAPPDD